MIIKNACYIICIFFKVAKIFLKTEKIKLIFEFKKETNSKPLEAEVRLTDIKKEYPMSIQRHKMQDPDHFNWRTFFCPAFAGGLGATLCFPFEAIKKKCQTGQIRTVTDLGQLITRQPRELYRGCPAFAVSVTVATVSAMKFRDLLRDSPYYDSSSKAHEASTAVTAGILGAVVGSTPVENIILYQQKCQVGPLPAIKGMLRQRLTRPWVGLPELMAREGGFAGFMLFGVGAAREKVFEKTGNKGLAEIAGIGMGVVGATMTQPGDSTATFKQEQELMGRVTMSSRDAIKEMYRLGGLSRFFAGLGGRTFLFTGCAILIPRIEEKAQSIFQGSRI